MKFILILALVSISSATFANSNCVTMFKDLTKQRQMLAELRYNHLLNQGRPGPVSLSSGPDVKNLTADLIEEKTIQYGQSYERLVATCSNEATLCGGHFYKTMEAATRYGVDAAKVMIIWDQLEEIETPWGARLKQRTDTFQAQNRKLNRTADLLMQYATMTSRCFEAVISR